MPRVSIADLILREFSIPADDSSDEFIVKRMQAVIKFSNEHWEFIGDTLTERIKLQCDFMGVEMIPPDNVTVHVVSAVARYGMLLGYLLKEKEIRESPSDNLEFLKREEIK